MADQSKEESSSYPLPKGLLRKVSQPLTSPSPYLEPDESLGISSAYHSKQQSHLFPTMTGGGQGSAVVHRRKQLGDLLER